MIFPILFLVDVPSSIEDEVIQVAEQDYGLICPSSGQLVPLKAFHIRAQLVDVTAEVCRMICFFQSIFSTKDFLGCTLPSLSQHKFSADRSQICVSTG